MEPLLDVASVYKTHEADRAPVRALRGLSLTIAVVGGWMAERSEREPPELLSGAEAAWWRAPAAEG